MGTMNNHHDTLVQFHGRWREGDLWGLMDEHLADCISVRLSIVTNTPDDFIGLASLTISVMGDGFFLISRSRVGGGSQYIASGQLERWQGTEQYTDAYARLHGVSGADRSALT